MSGLGRRKLSPLLRSTRGRFYKEKSISRSAPQAGRRTQKIKVRHRYVATVIKDAGERFWQLFKGALLLSAIIYASILGVHFWKTSPLIRVQEIKYYGDIPKRLPDSLTLRPGQNLLLINSFREQKNILRAFPELKDITVWRTPLRDIVIRGEYRRPVALFEKEGDQFGVDSTGFIFPITDDNKPAEPLPFVAGIRKGDLAKVMSAFITLKKNAPDFYSLISRLETDTMGDVNVELRDKINIIWGPLEERNLVLKARRASEVLSRYEPKKVPATLRFLTENRLVIDSNWTAKEDEKI